MKILEAQNAKQAPFWRLLKHSPSFNSQPKALTRLSLSHVKNYMNEPGWTFPNWTNTLPFFLAWSTKKVGNFNEMIPLNNHFSGTSSMMFFLLFSKTLASEEFGDFAFSPRKFNSGCFSLPQVLLKTFLSISLRLHKEMPTFKLTH